MVKKARESMGSAMKRPMIKVTNFDNDDSSSTLLDRNHNSSPTAANQNNYKINILSSEGGKIEVKKKYS